MAKYIRSHTLRLLTKTTCFWRLAILISSVASAADRTPENTISHPRPETSSGWQKSDANPILGGKFGTCFDISVLKEEKNYRMWVSWRPKKSIALVESRDGIHWSEPPEVVLPPLTETGWEDDINRPVVVKRPDGYHMWYTGQAKDRSWIGYATSPDGRHWRRMSAKPVLSPDQPWEKSALMCPHVLWDHAMKKYRMWYSGGGQYEPDAIGYAVSGDGLHWEKPVKGPVFSPDKSVGWEQDRVTGCQVVQQDGWHYMFYIGFRDIDHAQIGVARSKDGITNWQRHPQNPIVRPGENKWDHDACYKPYAIFDGKKWLLWYNGRHGSLEQIGVVLHQGKDLGFGKARKLSQAQARELQSDHSDFFGAVLRTGDFKHYIDSFNQNDRELYPQFIHNADAWDFLAENIPLFECPDRGLEEIYYFRWWTFRKHIKKTPDGFILTEFLPAVGWAGKHNSICCAAGHHLHEGRWLHDARILNDYSRFWFYGGGNPRTYSFWAADSIWSRYLVNGDADLPRSLLPELVKNYQAWEKDHLDANGLFWQADGNDGMEVSISGELGAHAQGYRATINSYMFGDALAIANIAELANNNAFAADFRARAAKLKRLVEEQLWDPEAKFFKVLPRAPNSHLNDVRELHGFTPWYFNLPGTDKAVAWKVLFDPQGFDAPFGPTTAERRHPCFALSYQGHECQWNGPSWPYSTSITLTALANYLNSPGTHSVTREDYFRLFLTYTKSHHLTQDNGQVVPWIDENLNPDTGDWIARTRLKTWNAGTWDKAKGGEERGKDYNHSTYNDLLITGLIGLHPRADEFVEINPLVPPAAWDFFCLDRVPYHGHELTILFDKTGNHYHRGKGLQILADCKLIGVSRELRRLTASLPE